MADRYEVIPSRRYRNLKNDRKASIYGACPWTGARDDTKADWVLETVGWTVRDNNTNTVGFGRVPWATQEEAQAFADSVAKADSERFAYSQSLRKVSNA